MNLQQISSGSDGLSFYSNCIYFSFLFWTSCVSWWGLFLCCSSSLSWMDVSYTPTAPRPILPHNDHQLEWAGVDAGQAGPFLFPVGWWRGTERGGSLNRSRSEFISNVKQTDRTKSRSEPTLVSLDPNFFQIFPISHFENFTDPSCWPFCKRVLFCSQEEEAARSTSPPQQNHHPAAELECSSAYGHKLMAGHSPSGFSGREQSLWFHQLHQVIQKQQSSPDHHITLHVWPWAWCSSSEIQRRTPSKNVSIFVWSVHRTFSQKSQGSQEFYFFLNVIWAFLDFLFSSGSGLWDIFVLHLSYCWIVTLRKVLKFYKQDCEAATRWNSQSSWRALFTLWTHILKYL